MTVNCKPFPPFFRRYPGPFIYRSGSDGVDDTFDIICVTTEERVISTYYWLEEAREKLVAQVVTIALDAVLLGNSEECLSYLHQLASAEFATFRQRYPGPFHVRRGNCEYYGRIYEVTCESTNETVIFRVDRGSRREANLVAKHIAAALNSLFQSCELLQANSQKPGDPYSKDANEDAIHANSFYPM